MGTVCTEPGQFGTTSRRFRRAGASRVWPVRPPGPAGRPDEPIRNRGLASPARTAVLLAAVPALAEVAGGAGLVFIDGHEDATTMEASATGEAANMEVALLLG